tara:strand:- start:1535 stop:1828 length:294 start_codon:yes stop_codon:yes gene_type:complete
MTLAHFVQVRIGVKMNNDETRINFGALEGQFVEALMLLLDRISTMVDHFEAVDEAFGLMCGALSIAIEDDENVINMEEQRQRLRKDPNEIYNNKGDE